MSDASAEWTPVLCRCKGNVAVNGSDLRGAGEAACGWADVEQDFNEDHSLWFSHVWYAVSAVRCADNDVTFGEEDSSAVQGKHTAKRETITAQSNDKADE